MKIALFQEYRRQADLGLKRLASRALKEFISSFENIKQKEEWVWEYLPTLTTNRHSRIRHEIFQELVYPILKTGYENSDFASTLWLGKLIQNLYQANHLHKNLDWVSEIQLFTKCHEIDPSNDEARQLLLRSLLSWFEFSEHEWPWGILAGNQCASIDDCDEISLLVQRFLVLDKEQSYIKFIEGYVIKLNDYRARLLRRDKS